MGKIGDSTINILVMGFLGVAFIVLPLIVFLVVFLRADMDNALRAWAALGPLIGVATGAVPTYFFAVKPEQQKRDIAEAAAREMAGYKGAMMVKDSAMAGKIEDAMKPGTQPDGSRT